MGSARQPCTEVLYEDLELFVSATLCVRGQAGRPSSQRDGHFHRAIRCTGNFEGSASRRVTGCPPQGRKKKALISSSFFHACNRLSHPHLSADVACLRLSVNWARSENLSPSFGYIFSLSPSYRLGPTWKPSWEAVSRRGTHAPCNRKGNIYFKIWRALILKYG